MSVRRNVVADARRRGHAQLDSVISDARSARINAGLSQRIVAQALGCSRQLIGAIERGELGDIGVDLLVRYCAAVGLDVSLRAFVGGSPLRDIGQVRLTERFLAAIGGAWQVRAEVPVSSDPLDRRAIDLVLASEDGRIGVEAVTRIGDGQAQSRSALLKQEAASLPVMILVLADTRHNREALAAGGATIRASFPLSSREVLKSLRTGEVPASNGVILI